VTLAQVQVNCGCSRADHFAIQHWPDGVVVYDDTSGSLHALTPVAGEAFSLIQTRQASDARSLAQAMGLVEPAAEELDMLESLLVQFESMGLIECTQG
jgi:PqqD family protein of HPr-rel-A system